MKYLLKARAPFGENEQIQRRSKPLSAHTKVRIVVGDRLHAVSARHVFRRPILSGRHLNACSGVGFNLVSFEGLCGRVG